MNENPMGGEAQATEGAADPAASAPIETPAAVPSGDATPVADWRASMPEGWADKLKDVESADDAMAALERGLSYNPVKSADEIKLAFPESFKGQVDEGVQQNFRELCVKEGITPAQAQALLDWQLGANKEITDKLIETGTQALKDAWGSRFDENKAVALKAFTALDKRMGGELSGSLAGRNMANDPAFVRAFYEIGKLISEDSLSSGALPSAADVRESPEATYSNMFKGE